MNLAEFTVISLNMFRLTILLKGKMTTYKGTNQTFKEVIFFLTSYYYFFFNLNMLEY